MKVLVTGANGQLGTDVVKELMYRGIQYCGATRSDFDLTDRQQTIKFITEYNPDVIIHCGAYTNVDKAQDESRLCYSVNVLGTEYVTEGAVKTGAKIVYISSDYVFDGKKDEPYEVDDIPNPINIYGYTKYMGEQVVQRLTDKYFIVRVSWLFGSNGKNFVKTMLRLVQENKIVKVVSDQIGSPTYTMDASRIIVDMIYTDNYGIYHLTNEGYCSWYEFAQEIFKQCNMDVEVIPITSDEYNSKAQRPKNSRLSKKSLEEKGFGKLRHWKYALSEYLYFNFHT